MQTRGGKLRGPLRDAVVFAIASVLLYPVATPSAREATSSRAPFGDLQSWLMFTPSRAAAQESRAEDMSEPKMQGEPWLLSGDASFALPLTEPQSDWFGPGATVGLSVQRGLFPWLTAGLRFRFGFLSDGDAPDETLQDPGLGSFYIASALLRVRPLGSRRDPARGTGLYLEGALGGGFTGEDLRPAIELGAGYGFEVGSVDIGPVIRFLQIIESTDALDNRDARLLLLGVEATLFDRRKRPPVVPVVRSDRDEDGLYDEDDACPDLPEDFDGFEDEDGCPDLDDDADGIPDTEDQCRLEPEDRDGFEDEDGCPDPDDDSDGFLDIDDLCPNEPEVVNGVEDDDGCPDEGLIELINDRIVLEERVLFDFDRVRIKSRGHAVLGAIIQLWRLHPEWAQVVIEGHADVRGTAEHNLDLSERRAAKVRQALVEMGMPAEMLTSVGYGEEHPRDLRAVDDAHQRNRRVEFVITARHPPSEAPPADLGQTPGEGATAAQPLEKSSDRGPWNTERVGAQ